MVNGKWIQKATAKHPGLLRAQAKAAGMTLGQYMAAPHRDPTIKKEIVVAQDPEGPSQEVDHIGRRTGQLSHWSGWTGFR